MTERYATPTELPHSEEATSISVLVGRLSDVLRTSFSSVFIEGEISNMSRPASGHLYFSLKDSRSQVKCVMWRSSAARLRFRPENGLSVRMRGAVGIYPARGDLQITGETMELAGEGDLQRALAMLKTKLEGEGLFDLSRKRSLPAHPSCIGVVTSDSSAAFRDIATVLERRYPMAKVVIRSVLVQGTEASEQIEAALREFNRLPGPHPQRPDVVILARGGGSLEDLWAFNEERSVRAVFASSIPIVTGVGHETDTTLCDLASDRRAATPSMAAEVAVPDRSELRRVIQRLEQTQYASMRMRIERVRALIGGAFRVRSHAHPLSRLDRARQQLDESIMGLDRAVSIRVDRARLMLTAKTSAWAVLDPLRPLGKGFALVTMAGSPIDRAQDVPDQALLNVQFSDDSIKVRRVRNEDTPASYLSDSETTEAL